MSEKEKNCYSLMVLSKMGLSYCSGWAEYKLVQLISLVFHFLLEVYTTGAVELIAGCHSTFREEYIAVGSVVHGQVLSEQVAFPAKEVFADAVKNFRRGGLLLLDCDMQDL